MPLERRRIGSTPFWATVMGFGTGGLSRAGLKRGRDHAIEVVASVLEAGIDFIDTAEGYGTEEVVAAGLARARVDPARVTVATKCIVGDDERLRTPAEVRTSVFARLEALQRDRLDLLHFHAVSPDRYRAVRDTHLPVLEELRASGVVTSIGITEAFTRDPGHLMLSEAVADGCWDTVMVGYNLLNPSARGRVITPAAANGTGVIVMFAVREALVDFERLHAYLAARADDLPDDVADRVDRLERLVAREGGSLTDLAYRFAASTPGVSTVLVGTGDPLHSAQNRAALEREPLGSELLTELEALFVDVEVLTGQASTHLPR
jgi:aryl-alcohol dehydrogenase-like predicted oxidoreductase